MQGNLEILSRCIKENLGFKDGKPIVACVIYKCLLHWHAFESERTAIFDFIIESINDELKVSLPFNWLNFIALCFAFSVVTRQWRLVTEFMSDFQASNEFVYQYWQC